MEYPWLYQSNLAIPWHYRGYAMLKHAMLKSGTHSIERVEEDINKALESFDRAIEIDPSLAEAWMSKGTCLILLKKYQQASDSFIKAFKNLNYKIEKTPEVPTWYFYMLMVKLAYVYNGTAITLEPEFYDEARKQFDNAIDTYKKLKTQFHDTIWINLEGHREF